MRSQRSGIRPGTSLSEHVARELERDYAGRYPTLQNISPQRRGPFKSSARGIKRFVFATAGGVKRVSVATGRKSVNVNRKFGRSVKRFAKWAYDEWAQPTRSPRKSTPPFTPGLMQVELFVEISALLRFYSRSRRYPGRRECRVFPAVPRLHQSQLTPSHQPSIPHLQFKNSCAIMESNQAP